jgi:hypothetical protein
VVRFWRGFFPLDPAAAEFLDEREDARCAKYEVLQGEKRRDCVGAKKPDDLVPELLGFQN